MLMKNEQEPSYKAPQMISITISVGGGIMQLSGQQIEGFTEDPTFEM